MTNLMAYICYLHNPFVRNCVHCGVTSRNYRTTVAQNTVDNTSHERAIVLAVPLTTVCFMKSRRVDMHQGIYMLRKSSVSSSYRVTMML